MYAHTTTQVKLFPVSFLVKLNDGRVVKRHLDHIRKWPLDQVQSESLESSTLTVQGLFTKEDIATVYAQQFVFQLPGDLLSPRVPQSSEPHFPSRTRAPLKDIGVERTLPTLAFLSVVRRLEELL